MTILDILKKYSKNDTHLTISVDTFGSPLGEIVAAADDDFLYIIVFRDSKNIEKQFHAVADEISCKFILGQNKILKSFKCEIHNYFDGKLRKFTTPIKLLGTEFQKEVWNKLLKIPYGSTQTYGSLAKEMGRPASHSRAVGAACGANPLLLVIPCHRLVASGSKGGFSCGMDRKEWLINHERNLQKYKFSNMPLL